MRQAAKHQVVHLSLEESIDLVDRIANRTENFDYSMTSSEKMAMAHLLSEIGVNVSDIIDVSNLADNYAINATIVSPDTYSFFDMRKVKMDHLFSWEQEGETYYCLSW